MYSGYVNRATYLVALVINNNESLYHHFQCMAGDTSVDLLAEVMEQEIRNAIYEVLESRILYKEVLYELLNIVLNDVDWIEIAEELLEQ